MKKNIVVRQIPNSDPWFQKEFEEILGKKAISKRKNLWMKLKILK